MPDSSRVIVVPDRGIPLLCLSISATRGSLLDPIGKEGTTRLLVRLMRRSTERMGAEAIDARLDHLGATLGGDVSPTTAGFHGACISRTSTPFLELTHAILTEPDFSEAEFLRVKEEVQAEWVESLDNDSLLARRAFSRQFFSGHPYARSPSGTPDSLARVELGDLKEVHSRLLLSGQVEVAFSGDIDQETASTFASHMRSQLPSQQLGELVLADPAGPQGRRLSFVDKPERTQTQILIGCLGTHPADLDHTALFLGHVIFGGTFTSRLSREVRGKRGWSYGASSDLPMDIRRQGFSLWTFPQAADAAACVELELKLLREFIERGVSQAELARAKKYLINSNVFASDTASKRASSALDRVIYGLGSDYHSGFIDRVRAVTVIEVNEAVTRRLSCENLQITVLGTHSVIGADIRRVVGQVEHEEVVAYDSTN